MLHSAAPGPSGAPSMEAIGRFVTTAAGGWRAAALKAASKGHTTIYLRKTGTKQCREYAGRRTPLETPKAITRGDRTVTYSHRPNATFVRSFVYDDK